MTLRIVLGTALVAGGVAALAPASAAYGSSAPKTVIKLSVVPQAGGPGRSATLTCEPVGGDHPYAVVACDELAKTRGDVQRVPGASGRFCLPYESLVVANATGYWLGKPIQPYSEVITNDGCAAIAHGRVLDF
ncbi:SSI family serine proteinase inhibitor [Actinomadura sp. 1N219]|uniref:SSI family serine proteinase inhibitor n=1 Tax=Actinomadura sp. 1N219 TaxID=3375152 RepID=UPI0037AE3F6E